jgi:hypothetical protein
MWSDARDRPEHDEREALPFSPIRQRLQGAFVVTKFVNIDGFRGSLAKSGFAGLVALLCELCHFRVQSGIQLLLGHLAARFPNKRSRSRSHIGRHE